jgi:large subunit ribosomal protein L23
MALFKKTTPKTKKTTEIKAKDPNKAPKFSHNHFTCQPYLTEKTTEQRETGKYTFMVSNNTNKIEVKRFIEKFYNVKVAEVNISHKFFSPVNFRGKESKKSPVKKAIVTLKEGQKIEFNV